MHIKIDLSCILCNAYHDMAGFSVFNTRGVTRLINLGFIDDFYRFGLLQMNSFEALIT
jgi:hypothetical protein